LNLCVYSVRTPTYQFKDGDTAVSDLPSIERYQHHLDITGRWF